MRKLYIFIFIIQTVLILLNTEKADAQSNKATTFILSNEAPGHLIDTLIATGYGNFSLFEILYGLQGASGSIITEEFIDTLAYNPSGSEIFTKKLSSYAGLNGSIAINSDGTVKLISIYGKDYYQKKGYKTYPNYFVASPGREIFTYATSPEYYIDAGTGTGGKKYKAFAITWSKGKESDTSTALTFILSNEAPGHLIDTLIALKYGNASIFDVVLHLQGGSGGVIPEEFMDTLACNPSGSEIFTKKLSSYAGLNGSIAINSDGTVKTVSIFGKNYYQLSGYKTYPYIYSGSGKELFTYAVSPVYYINAGTSSGGKKYKAFALGWSMDAAPTTFILSNEKPGCLIDSLIAAGYGNDNFFEILTSIQLASGSIISDEFLETLAGNPSGSEIFTKALSNFAGLDSSVAINTDGTYKLVSIKGRDYYKKAGYTTYPETSTGTGRELFTYATSPEYYIDAGTGSGAKQYKAFAIAWAKPQENDTTTALTFILSNEAPGYLIDNLIANGYGDSSLYSVMLALQPVSGAVIRQSFLDTLKACPAGSEIFTTALKNFSGLNNPVGINSDGSLIIAGIFGKDYYNKQGYSTGNSSTVPIELKLFTSANSSERYIDAGTRKKNDITIHDKAFAIAWSRGSTVVISNEAPGYLIDTLIAKGYGKKNLFEVLSALQPVSGGSIPENYIKQLSAFPKSSDIFTATLDNFAGLNNPACINTDGSVAIQPIFGRNYINETDFKTYRDSLLSYAHISFTYTNNPDSYIDAGFGSSQSDTIHFRAFTIIWSDNVTGIPELNKDKETISIYPNPFSDGIYISNIGCNAEIDIYDIFGRNVYNSNIESNCFISLSSQPDGVYWAKIKTEKGILQQVLIRQE